MSEPMDVIKIGESEYTIVKTGRAQADQVIKLTRWIGKHGATAMRAVTGAQDFDGTSLGAVSFIGQIVGGLDVDALVELFTVVTGCTLEEANVYFDIATLVDVALEVYERQPAIKRLLDRFFSTPVSPAATEELSTTPE